MTSAVPTATPTSRALMWCLHLLIVGLLAVVAVRALVHGGPRTAVVVAVAAACALAYGAGVVGAARRAAIAWLAVVCAGWLALLALTADGVWVAFPLYFLQLHLLRSRPGLAAVVATALAAIGGFAAHQGALTPAVVLGPALGAAVAVAVVWGYQALYRLIGELTATRADLAEAQHTAGVLAERERLAREIHDTLAQGLSSIHLLLRAAERTLPDQAAAEHVVQARKAAADNLAEARRFVAELSPPALDDTTLLDALERLCANTSAVAATVTGTQMTLPKTHEVALLRVAQAAVTNTIQHAKATTARLTLTREDDQVLLTITDNGTGFDEAESGFGLTGMRARTEALDGTFTVRSAPNQGTTITARLPLPHKDSR